jgi:antitoxin component YwqK of YwqJK toxin-antitoxin module
MLIRNFRSLFILIFTISLIGCTTNSTQKEVIEIYPNGQPKVVYYKTANNVLQKKEEYYDSGNKKSLIEYKGDSILHGRMIKWFENGTLLAKGKFENNLRVDTSFQYEINGNLKRTFYYQNDKPKVITDYYPDGKTHRQLNYLDGMHKLWFPSGQLENIIAESDGDFIDYFPNGKIKMKGIRENRKREGVYYYFTEMGDTLKTITFESGFEIDSTLY